MTAADFDRHDCYVGEIWDWVGLGLGLQMVFVSPSRQFLKPMPLGCWSELKAGRPGMGPWAGL